MLTFLFLGVKYARYTRVSSTYYKRAVCVCVCVRACVKDTVLLPHSEWEFNCGRQRMEIAADQLRDDVDAHGSGYLGQRGDVILLLPASTVTWRYLLQYRTMTFIGSRLACAHAVML